MLATAVAIMLNLRGLNRKRDYDSNDIETHGKVPCGFVASTNGHKLELAAES